MAKAAPRGFPYAHRTVAQVDRASRSGTSHGDFRRQLFGSLVHNIAPVVADRTPCPRCGIRVDIGCAHSAATQPTVAASEIARGC